MNDTKTGGFCVLFKKEVHVSKSHRKEMEPKVSHRERARGSVGVDVGEYKTTGFWVKEKYTKCILGIN